MRAPPADLPVEELADCLRANYGLPITDVTFLPLGHDAGAWVYRAVAADGATYFVKIRLKIGNRAGLLVPHYLAERGVSRVVAPLTTIGAELSSTVSRYGVIVYPFVSEQTGLLHGMSDAQWIEYGVTLRKIHAVNVSAELRDVLRTDTFRPDGAESLKVLAARVLVGKFTDQRQRTIAHFWRSRADTIRVVFTRANELSARVAAAQLPLVLCHADIHTNNVLVDGTQHIAVVDWDETMLAPRERDLMFVVGGLSREFVTPDQERLFFEGYGGIDIDPIALAYYRYAWAVSDIAAYGEEVFSRSDLSAADRDEAVARFMGLFAEGDTVEIALSSPT